MCVCMRSCVLLLSLPSTVHQWELSDQHQALPVKLRMLLPQHPVRLQIDYTLSLCLSPPCLFLSLRLSVFHVSAGRCCSVSAGPRVEGRGAEVSGGGEGTGGPA